MRSLLILLFFLPLGVFGHTSQISTFALVRDAKGQWTAHLSASLEAFETALGKKKFSSAEAFQKSLIQLGKKAIKIKAGVLHPITFTDGQCHLGHQTDLKFTIIGIPPDRDLISVENSFFEDLESHFMVFKVMVGAFESNQVILQSSNRFSAQVNIQPGGITVDSEQEFNYYYLLFIAPIILLLLFKYHMKKSISMVLLGTLFFSCSTNDSTVTPVAATSIEVPSVYKKIYGASSVTSDGTTISIKVNGLPDHKSPYYATTNSLYQSYSGVTFGGLVFIKNPNSIIEQSGIFKIPINPKMATNHAATPLGPIGIALNGVPFFNQYAGPNNQELKGEMAGFDQFYGHPQNSGVYHYHVEPLHLTTVKSTKSGLMGFLLDGFPVYGPQEETGSAVTNANLDVYHGHSHATVDYPNGIYHYHFTSEAPYLNGNGFYGTPGTVTQ
jgi:hypothetical protein